MEMEATTDMKQESSVESTGYHYHFWSVFLFLGGCWIVVGVFTYIVCLLVYPLTGYLPHIYGLELVIIVVATLYISKKLAQQVVFETTATGIKQGEIFITYPRLTKVEYLKNYGLRALYLFEVGKDEPSVTIFWPKHIVEVKEAIHLINIRTGKQINLN